jgi:succinate dehydrogenase / fumarate reductase cytochrome b subunit
LHFEIWSDWQSIGLPNSKISPVVYAIALILAILIAVGFIALPLAIYYNLLN